MWWATSGGAAAALNAIPMKPIQTVSLFDSVFPLRILKSAK